MNLKALIAHLLKEDAPDEEERIETPQTLGAAPRRDSHTIEDSEKGEKDVRTGAEGDGTTFNGNGGDLDADVDHDSDDQELHVDLDKQPDARPRSLPHRILSRAFSIVCPSPSDEEEIQAYIPHYRLLPIISGITIPFAILLEIPGLTQSWYIRMNGTSVTASKANTPLLDLGIALSLFCALMANLCLIVRFLEKRIKTMTILCIMFLSIHDSINVAVLAAFGATKHSYSLGQEFWIILCSTIVSMLTNVTLIFDYVRTRNFKHSGSGLTRRQRSLVIIIIGLFCYLALGALVNSLLLNLSFINGLYFTVVTIETIGFGDIVPNSPGSRVFICFYATLGVINVAFVVGYLRETVLEGLDFGYRRRLLAIQERRRIARRRRRAEKRWKHAIVWRLRKRNLPIWIQGGKKTRESLWSKLKSCFWGIQQAFQSTANANAQQGRRHRHGTQLNLWALPRCELEAAALEAGVPLDTLLPADFYETYDQDACHHDVGAEHRHLPSWFAIHPVYHYDQHADVPPTHRRVGVMAAMLTKVGLFIYESGGKPLPSGHIIPDSAGPTGSGDSQDGSGTLGSEEGDYHADVMGTEKKAYYTRSGVSWAWFLIFWMGGAVIFKSTEDWTYATSLYFCFISFSTIGYGDLTPTTPAGRAIFVVWALVGVATMTIFISVISEAYTSRYKGILGGNTFKHIVQKYRNRNKAELSEKVQRIATSTGVEFRREDTFQSEIEYVSPLPSAAPALGAVASTSKSDPQVQDGTQRPLEQLPRQILTETRSIQQYLQFIADRDHTVETERFVDETIWGLVDDVMGGKTLPDQTKKDILKDDDARQTLMMLGIERSLRELVDISEQAIVGIQERDRIIARMEREKESEDEAESVSEQPG